MIKINLLPLPLRRVKSKTPPVPYKPLGILAGVLFLLLTLFFYFDYLRARSTYATVSKEWKRLSPLMGQLKTLENKIEVEMRGEKEFLEKQVLNTQPITSFMIWASEFLPDKAWLTKFVATREGEGVRLTIQGVVFPSRTQTGIEQIETYLQKLKEKLPAQAELQLVTSKDAKQEEGITFSSHFEWGVSKK